MRPASPYAAPAHDAVDGAAGLVGVARDDHALAAGQAVGLDDQGAPGAADVALGLVGIVEDREGRGWNPVALTEALHEGLRSLELGGGPARPEGADAPRLESVHEPERQRELRADDDQIGALGDGQGDQARHVVRADVRVAGDRLGPRVARSDDHVVPALHDGRGERVLARSGPDDHDSLAACHLPRVPGARNMLTLRPLGRILRPWLTLRPRRLCPPRSASLAPTRVRTISSRKSSRR